MQSRGREMLRTTRRAGARVVVVGAGTAGVEAALALRKQLRRRDTVTLVASDTVLVHRPDALYVPFGGPVEPIMHPLAGPIREAGIELVAELAHAIDPAARIIATARRELRYDAAVIATGARAAVDRIPGFAANAQLLWRLPDLIRLRFALHDLDETLKRGARAKVLFVVPPANRWAGPVYETALMLDTWLRRRHRRDLVEISVATAEGTLLEALGAGAHATLRHELRAHEIESHLGASLRSVEPGRACFDGAADLEFDLLVGGVPYAAGAELAALPADEHGLLRIDGSMAVRDTDALYAIGDATATGVKQAPAAIAHASLAAESVRCMLRGEALPSRELPRPIYLMDALDRAICVVGPTGLADVGEGEEVSRASTSLVWRLARRTVAGHLARRFGAGLPVSGGARWLGMRAARAGLVAALAD